MSHADYLKHLKAFFAAHADDPLIAQAQTASARELIILSSLDLSAAREFLEAHYCPVKRRPPRDPVCMLRLLLLMLLCGVESITKWIQRLRTSPLLAALTGFAPDQIPGIGTCYAFKARLVNGPYQKPCEHVTRPADALKRRHTRHLKDQTDDRHAYPPIYHSESDALSADLLAHAAEPRPDTLQTRLEDLFVTVGLLPSLEAGLFETLDRLADTTTTPAAPTAETPTDDAPTPAALALEVSGDGSPLETAASPQVEQRPDVRLTQDGVPRCPAGCPMAHHHYDAAKHTHVFTCPAKRLTHRGGTARYAFFADDCPRHTDCCPDSTLKPLVYLKSDDDRRLFPPIPRDSTRFTRLYDQRTSTERLNALNDRYKLDRRSRNAAYGAIYLTLANICEHAVVRFLETLAAAASLSALLAQTMAAIMQA